MMYYTEYIIITALKLSENNKRSSVIQELSSANEQFILGRTLQCLNWRPTQVPIYNPVFRGRKPQLTWKSIYNLKKCEHSEVTFRKINASAVSHTAEGNQFIFLLKPLYQLRSNLLSYGVVLVFLVQYNEKNILYSR